MIGIPQVMPILSATIRIFDCFTLCRKDAELYFAFKSEVTAQRFRFIAAVGLAKTVLRAITTKRENAEAHFKQIFETAESIAQTLNITITTPRTTSRQTKRCNAPAQDPEEHFRRNIYIPSIDTFIAQLNTKFLKHENILSWFSCLLPTGRPIDEDEMTQFIELCRFYSYDLAPYSDSFLKSTIQLWHHKFCGQNTAIP